MLKPQLISSLLSTKANGETLHLSSYHFLSYLETTHLDLRGFKNPREKSHEDPPGRSLTTSIRKIL